VEPNALLIKIQYFSSGLILGFCALHLILYAYWRSQKSNLHYALFLLFLALTVFFDFQTLNATEQQAFIYLRLQRASLTLSLIAALFFFYTLFGSQRGRAFHALVPLIAVAGIAATIKPIGGFLYLQILMIAALVDIIRAAFNAIRKESGKIWIIGIGFLVLLLFGSYDILLDANFISAFLNLTNGYQFGVFGLILTTSIYLARDISETNKKVVQQEKEMVRQILNRQRLREEVERTRRELRDARDLQLSMLPEQLPQRANLDIAARMQTATEVGGDYYDFNEMENGRLTIAIGDATGHGNRAGFMVAIIKSLFKSMQPGSNFPHFFNQVSRILRQMNLGTLFMALSCVEIKDHILTASSAGMPPLLLYRYETQEVEEHIIKGMPLGAVSHFPYSSIRLELNHKDTILLISDGLQELFNDNREMFGWDRVKWVFGQNARLKPQEIIDRLETEANRWKGEHPIEDDLTYVVVKYISKTKA